MITEYAVPSWGREGAITRFSVPRFLVARFLLCCAAQIAQISCRRARTIRAKVLENRATGKRQLCRKTERTQIGLFCFAYPRKAPPADVQACSRYDTARPVSFFFFKGKIIACICCRKHPPSTRPPDHLCPIQPLGSNLCGMLISALDSLFAARMAALWNSLDLPAHAYSTLS